MLDEGLLEALNASILDDAAFDTVLARLAARFRCPSAALVYVDSALPAAKVAKGYGLLTAEAQRRYQEHYARDDPAPAAMAKLKVGEVVTTGRLFDADDKRYRRFIEEFYYPLGLRESLGGPVSSGEGRPSVLAVQRGDDRGAFDDADIEAFAEIVPHVCAALRLRRRFFELEASAVTLRSALDAAPVAFIICDARGRLRHANLLARSLIDRRDGLTLNRTGRIGAIDASANQQLALAFARPSSSRPWLIRVPRGENALPYVVKVEPSDPGIIPCGLNIKICDPTQADQKDTASLIAVSLQMPLGSAKVTAALLNGDDLATTAKRAGSSLNTIKFHLKAAFEASGTRRQADLVRVASAIVRDLR